VRLDFRRTALSHAEKILIFGVFALIEFGSFAANVSTISTEKAGVLPGGVEPVWALGQAFHQTTPTRERICLNGLWRWQPSNSHSSVLPTNDWGFFKVPGCWPGITDYMQKDCQTLFTHPNWNRQPLREVTTAWYEREFSVPAAWAGRRISLSVASLNSFAQIFVDGKAAGEVRFPGGELEISDLCLPGRTQHLTVLVVALPLKGVLLSYADSASAREVRGKVERRGLCGDVFLNAVPAGERLTEIRIQPSVRNRECTFDVSLAGLQPERSYRVQATVSLGIRRNQQWTSQPFHQSDLTADHFRFKERWLPHQLWDITTPENLFEAELCLLDSDGKTLDQAWPERFGFRELWIDGRDFYLNGSRIFLSAVPLDNAQVSAATATYSAARESLQRLKDFGINYVYTHNYGCEPGSHLDFEEILRAADDVGMLVGLSQPHFSHYGWGAAEAERTNGYAGHAEYYVRVAGNHSSVVMYPMSHNATGYDEDMNPDGIGGTPPQRDTWSQKNATLAFRAEAIVRNLDPGRIVYHHASGNLGVMHDSNFYPNFAPIQELSDWFEHWATVGTKPAFTCEYGAPFTWDWTMYRGWYRGEREFGSAAVPWEFCLAEWNSQFFGDRAFAISEPEKANLRWEARQFKAGKLWHRWDYPVEVGSTRFEERYPVFAAYLTDNWRAFRTWGVSAISPWEYGHFWKLRDGVDKRRRQLPVDWANLQRPGFSPDYIDEQYERMDLAFERTDWVATPAAQALLRNNLPTLAYIAGEPNRFTSKDHNFLPGRTVEKQLVVINNSRRPVGVECQWSLALPRPVKGSKRIKLETGAIEKIPLRFELPTNLSPGIYNLAASFHFSHGGSQSDEVALHVLAPASPPKSLPLLALFDLRGESRTNLDTLGIQTRSIGSDTPLTADDILIIGKGALTLDSPMPDLTPVRDGLKVLVFEQTAEALEKRLGFRVEEYGLRRVYSRVPDHPALRGLVPENFHDWRGEATLTPPRLDYVLRPRYGPTVQWCDLPVSRVWRCGNRGNVASVLIEKPTRGNFLPIVDGGFSQQFSPLLEYREGKGVIVFCQLDVTGRTERDPAADRVVQSLVDHLRVWKPTSERKALYLGEEPGRTYLQKLGVPFLAYAGQPLATEDVLILAPGVTKSQAPSKDALLTWLRSGGSLLAIGLNENQAQGVLPFEVTIREAEHIACFFEPPKVDSLLAGIAPADVHNRDPRSMPLISAGARVLGDGVLAQVDGLNVAFCQAAPWQFDPGEQLHLRRTYRRSAFTLSRLLANLGVASPTPLLERFRQPVTSTPAEKRFLSGLYLDQPQDWDDPYRFFRW
jgi:beta-galactosidase